MAQTPCVYRQLGDTLDHTPVAAVTAGDVILIGTTITCIAPVDIAAGVKSSISVFWSAARASLEGAESFGGFTRSYRPICHAARP